MRQLCHLRVQRATIQPVPNPQNKNLYKKYQRMAETENVTFVGRLANYKYFNMDQAILNSLELHEKDTK
jgi:UDP-galactopyranose mutase